MKKILWISPYAPYDTVAHAGGKNHNFYIKEFAKSGLFEITLLTLAQESEISKLDCTEYGIDCRYAEIKEDFFHSFKRYFYNLGSEYNPFNRYYGVFANYQRKLMVGLLKNEAPSLSPDTVILQWTQCLLLNPIIERFWPNAKIVAIEEDVSYLKYSRRLADAGNLFSSRYWKIKHSRLKDAEIEYLKKSSLVVVNNFKDKELLEKDAPELESVFIGPAYYDAFEACADVERDKTIVFYGAMNRKENDLSVKWFIKKVMPELPDFRLLIIGGGVKRSLKKLECKNVKICGYVKEPQNLWKNALCMVVPLLYGAGIKIKVLEAFSSGIPVVTNDIGIEGIAAKPGSDYLHCETASDYVDSIKKLDEDHSYANGLAENALDILVRDFDNHRKIQELINLVYNL